MSPITVTRLAVTAIKGTQLQQVDEIELGLNGARGDRRFYLVDERDRLINGKLASALQTVDAGFDEATGQLRLRFADGTVVEDRVASAGHSYQGYRSGVVVDGPWAAALSELTGRELRLIQTDSAVDRGPEGAVSLMSQASLDRLARQAQTESIDGRRFRMLVEIDGVDPHAEDDWIGVRARIGEAMLQFEGHVGRCKVTTFGPATGERDFPTLNVLRSYRRELDTTEPLAFGIYGRVLEGGHVTIGDRVTLQ